MSIIPAETLRSELVRKISNQKLKTTAFLLLFLIISKFAYSRGFFETPNSTKI